MLNAVEHKNRLREYFDGVGFERWSAIYGQSELSRIRRTIRVGHARMLTLAETWLSESLDMRAAPTVLDAGCGTGLFTLALARRGCTVTSVDIAPQMAEATRRNAAAAGLQQRVTCSAGDLEATDGLYDAAVCLDVLIHYPQPSFAKLCTHLAQRRRGPLLFTYAPHRPVLAALHWLGGRFPKNERRTDIQMIPDAFVRQTLAANGLQVKRSASISEGFYHVTLLEAAPIT